MKFKTHRLGKYSGLIVQASNKDPLIKFSPPICQDLIKTHGVVLFRNFSITPENFGLFVKNNSRTTTLDPTRVFFNDTVQRVHEGTDSIDLHSEHSNSPFRPDLIWFLCHQAPQQNGQTTYCDGVRIWKALNQSTQQLFIDNKIQYHRTFPEQIWKIFIARTLAEPLLPEDITATHLQQVFANKTGVTLNLNDDESLAMTFISDAFNIVLNQQKSLTNSLFGPYPGQTITLENSEPLPAQVVQEIKICYDEFTEEILWENTDVVAIDNTRFMHGRRSSEDLKRELFSVLSFF